MSCFFRHRWAKWELVEVTLTDGPNSPPRTGTRLKRVCEKCGLVELRKPAI